MRNLQEATIGELTAGGEEIGRTLRTVDLAAWALQATIDQGRIGEPVVLSYQVAEALAADLPRLAECIRSYLAASASLVAGLERVP